MRSLIVVMMSFGLSWSLIGADAARPNIIIILADDWGWGDLSCHGHPYIKTPNLDRLAREGTEFTRFTVASPVCSPSRAAIMTGQFPARYNIDGHFAYVPSNQKRNMPDWLQVEAPLLPRFLQQAGYRTAHFGKWHLGNDMIPDSPVPGLYGYDEYGAFNCSGEQMPVHEDVQHAQAFIAASVAAKKPFFLNLWIHEPHTPFHTVPKYEQRFADLPQNEDRIYASVLSHADERIGLLLAQLETLGVKDETLVIFTSDNGPARSTTNKPVALMYDSATGAGWDVQASRGTTAGRKGYKASLYEGGINVPCFVRWPGKVPAGRVDDKSLLSAVDLLPTLCKIAGVSLPSTYQSDGLDQSAVFLGGVAAKRDKPLFWRFPSKWSPTDAKSEHWASYVVVHQQWKLLVAADGSHSELYDLNTDPLEQHPIDDAAEVRAQLLPLLQTWQATLPAQPTGAVFSALRQQVKQP